LVYQSSINALRELLKSEDKSSYYHSAPFNQNCHITKRPQELTYTGHGQEYCFVQVSCDDGVQYGIQAFGDEAIELYEEANKAAICIV
jgi:hypothetical protein